jgi:hypothetical protein
MKRVTRKAYWSSYGHEQGEKKSLKRTRVAKEGFTFPSFLFSFINLLVTDSSQLMTTPKLSQWRVRTSDGATWRRTTNPLLYQ